VVRQMDLQHAHLAIDRLDQAGVPHEPMHQPDPPTSRPCTGSLTSYRMLRAVNIGAARGRHAIGRRRY
jgi:hypothetical protein